MLNRNQYQKQREGLALSSQKLLKGKIRALQTEIYLRVLEILLKIKTDENDRIDFRLENTQLIYEVNLTINQFSKKEAEIAEWVGKKVFEQIGLNALYFKAFLKFDYKVILGEVLEFTMRRLGYDAEKGRLIRGGYLLTISGLQSVAKATGFEISKAMAGNIGITEFRQNLKSLFLNPQGLGVLERHYQTVTNDIFQQYDRQINLTYADKLGLQHALYSGSIVEDSRPFCIERVNKVFTADEIKEWADLEFKGKNKNYIPESDCGGYNCRHHLNWISKEIAERLRPDLKNI